MQISPSMKVTRLIRSLYSTSIRLHNNKEKLRSRCDWIGIFCNCITGVVYFISAVVNVFIDEVRDHELDINQCASSEWNGQPHWLNLWYRKGWYYPGFSSGWLKNTVTTQDVYWKTSDCWNYIVVVATFHHLPRRWRQRCHRRGRMPYHRLVVVEGGRRKVGGQSDASLWSQPSTTAKSRREDRHHRMCTIVTMEAQVQLGLRAITRVTTQPPPPCPLLSSGPSLIWADLSQDKAGGIHQRPQRRQLVATTPLVLLPPLLLLGHQTGPIVSLCLLSMCVCKVCCCAGELERASHLRP